MFRFAAIGCVILAAVASAATCETQSRPAQVQHPTATVAGGHSNTTWPAAGLYIALGDSLSAGMGASRPMFTAFVPLVREQMPELTLLNLGHSGDTSQDLLDSGRLDEATAKIRALNGDGDPANDVQLVTLEIGGNDLLGIYFSLVLTGVCPDEATSLATPQCVDALRSALDTFRINFAEALDKLRQADPSVEVVVLTLYNPSGDLPDIGPLTDISLEGKPGTPFVEGLNDIIRSVAAGQANVTVADVYPLFQGRSLELVSPDMIHPNDSGYAVMADAVLQAITGRDVP